MGVYASDGIDSDRDELIAERDALRIENSALKQSKALLQALVNAIGESVYAKDEEGTYILANPAAARFLDRTVDDVLGRDDTALFSADFARQIMANDREIMAGREARTYAEFALAGGATRTFVTTKGPYCDEHGRVIGVLGMTRDITMQPESTEVTDWSEVILAHSRKLAHLGYWKGISDAESIDSGKAARIFGTCQDITELKRTEEAIEKSRQRFQAIFENALDGFLLLDDAGSIVGANGALCQSLDYSPEEISRLTIRDIMPVRAGEQASQFMERLLTERKLSGECHVVCKGGATREVEYRSVANILPGLHLAVHRDISDRKRAEAALRQSESLLADSQEIAHVGSWNLDIATGKLIWSDEQYRIFGVAPGSAPMTFDRFQGLVHPEDRALVQFRYEYALRESRPFEACYRAVRPDGTERIIQSRARIIRGDDGEPVGMLGSVQDITERKMVEQTLQASEQLFRAVFEGALDAMVLTDDDGRYVNANPAACKLFGMTLEELLEHQVSHFVAPGTDVDVAWSDFRKMGSSEGFFRLVRPDGSVRDAEYAAKADVIPGCHLSVLRDATERTGAERAQRRYAERLAMLHETDRAILAARSPVQVAQAALERLGGIMPLWRGSVAMIDLQAYEALIFAVIGASGEQFPVGARLGLDEFGARDLEELQAHRVLFVDDIATADVPLGPMVNLPALGVRSYVRVPLTNDGRLLGSLNLYSDRARAFDRDHIDVACEVADSLAIAIRQAQLFEEVKTSRESLTDLSRRLFRAEESERRRIAGELHDEIGQALTALKINLRAMTRNLSAPNTTDRLEDSIALTERTIEQVRGLSLDLRPALLDDLGLVPALRSYVGGMGRRLDLEVLFVVDEGFGRQDPEIETACYRIAQEAMTNVAKHSAAKTVEVELAISGQTLGLFVADDGLGFDVTVATARAAAGASLGLLGMRERAALLGGQVQIVSAPGRGTTVSATFPLGLEA